MFVFFLAQGMPATICTVVEEKRIRHWIALLVNLSNVAENTSSGFNCKAALFGNSIIVANEYRCDFISGGRIVASHVQLPVCMEDHRHVIHGLVGLAGTFS